jgi:hypothetical protein
MKLLQASAGRIVDGAIVLNEQGEPVLVANDRVYGVLDASEAGFRLIDATDEERRALVEAGYALPSDVGFGEAVDLDEEP